MVEIDKRKDGGGKTNFSYPEGQLAGVKNFIPDVSLIHKAL